MKAGTWVQIVFYRAHHRFVARGKLYAPYLPKRLPKYHRDVELECTVFLNGYIPDHDEYHRAWKYNNALFVPRKIAHIRKLSKDVALAMEL
jgi:hypothetical protein